MDLRVQIDKVSNGYICFDSIQMKSKIFTSFDELIEYLERLFSNPKKESEVVEKST